MKKNSAINIISSIEKKRLKNAEKKIEVYYNNFCNSFDALEKHMIFLRSEDNRNSLKTMSELIFYCKNQGDFFATKNIQIFLEKVTIFSHQNSLLNNLVKDIPDLKKELDSFKDSIHY